MLPFPVIVVPIGGVSLGLVYEYHDDRVDIFIEALLLGKLDGGDVDVGHVEGADLVFWVVTHILRVFDTLDLVLDFDNGRVHEHLRQVYRELILQWATHNYIDVMINIQFGRTYLSQSLRQFHIRSQSAQPHQQGRPHTT